MRILFSIAFGALPACLRQTAGNAPSAAAIALWAIRLLAPAISAIASIRLRGYGYFALFRAQYAFAARLFRLACLRRQAAQYAAL